MGGYDPAQVDRALAERDERLDQLEREAQQLAGRVIDAERRLRAQVSGIAEAAGAIGGLGRRLDELGGQARRRAVKLRLGAREAVQLAERATELSRLRQELGPVIAELARMAGIRLGGEAGSPGAGEGPPGGAYRGEVEVEVGPLRDFAQLTRFEDAVAGIGAASEVRVSSFSRGRATFSMRFARPVDLVGELEQRTPFPFSVRAAGADGVVLDVADQPRDAA